MPKKSSREAAAELRATSERFKLFLDREFKGNQSALASLLEVSQPAVSRVITGEQLPSGKLIMALAKHTRLNLHWLSQGHGEMLRGEAQDLGRGAAGKALAVPVVDAPLPGSPAAHPDLLTGELLPLCGTVLRPSQYWLRIQRGEPITRSTYQKVKAGDLFLMETDRARFREVEHVYDQLWVVRLSPGPLPRSREKTSVYRLAHLDQQELDYFAADTFDLGPDPATVVEETVIRRCPGEEPYVFTRQIEQKQVPGKRFATESPIDLADPRYERRCVRARDLVAFRVLTLRR